MHVISSILNIEVEKFPIRYLGIPLTSKRISSLLDKIQARLTGWRSKVLSYVGRVELNMSTLSSLHIFRVTVFILPQLVLASLERCIRDFFWNA